jgi:hypothetical protein
MINMEDSNLEKQIDSIEKKLDEVIIEVHRKRSTGAIDFLTAVLLSLATVGSAWCAFQSTLWDGIQTFKLMDAHQAGRLASQKEIESYQIKSMNAVLLIQYIDNVKAGNKEMADFYFSRFDPQLKEATIEWLKLDPFNNPGAPNSPMKLTSYKLEEEKAYTEEMDRYIKEMEIANEANHNSDNYVMLTVIFAAVLFFGGIASTLRSNLMRDVSIFLSAVIFIISIVILFFMPYAPLLG